VAQAIYGLTTSPDQLAQFGLYAADLDDTVEVYPDVWPAFMLLDAMGTQWRTGMGGPTGLDYSALPHVMRLLEIPKNLRNSLFQDLRVMEAEALLIMSESK
jgi:hypothetical protein